METTPLYNLYDKTPWADGSPTIELDNGARRLVSYGYPVAIYEKNKQIYRIQARCDKEMFRHIKEFVRQLEGVEITPWAWFCLYNYRPDPFRPGLPDPISARYASAGDRVEPYDYDFFERRF